MAIEHLSEAERAASVPGIEFVTGTDGTRRAKPRGTGLEVWQLIRIWRACDENVDEVIAGWLLERWQIDAALRYYALYPEEIDWHLEETERFNAWMLENCPVVFTPDGWVRYHVKYNSESRGNSPE